MHASVIIPTFNRKDALLETLRAASAQDLGAGAWELIVVDDGSTDGTEQAARDFIESTAARVRYLKQENAGPAAARNRGAAAAGGRVLLFIDNDILVKPDFISRHLATLDANPNSWVTGRVVNSPEMRRTPFGRYRDDLWEEFHLAHGGRGVTEVEGLTAANVSLPAADFRRLGGFDEGFSIASCEDWELGSRARREGVRILYNPDIVVVHNDWAVSLEKFCERQRLYSISDVLLWRKYGEDSPRASLVRQNMAVNRAEDGWRTVVKKTLKRSFSAGALNRLTWLGSRLAERVAPDSRLSRRAYRLVIAAATFDGVREGLRRYPEAPRQEQTRTGARAERSGV
jgi:GT2 family glycosyltransferase